MPRHAAAAAAALLMLLGCATQPTPTPAPPPTPASALVDRLGDSPETAVEVPADAPNEGVDFENNWIYDRFGRFRRDKWAIAQAEGRHYKVLTVELADHTYRTVYFDITETWNAWQPSPSPKQ